MKQRLILWIEDYLFYPNSFQKLISFLLLPLTFIYLLIILLKRAFAKEQDFSIPIISIGNLTIGGSGKTPVAIALAKKYDNSCVILRGYGRASKGLIVVSLKGDIKVDVEQSGDEAMLLAKSLQNSTIIVCEDRVLGINEAIKLGSKIVFLDDGFSKYHIKKFDILLRNKKEPTNIFCLPSGAYREPKGFYSKADLILKDGSDFIRKVVIKKDDKESILPEKTLLLTAISKPKRVLEFLPKDIKTLFFEDHHNFTKTEIDDILENYKDFAIVTTPKDFVKLERFNIKDIYIMDLSIEFNSCVDFSLMSEYIEQYKSF